MRKKTLSLILALAMCLGLTVPALAQDMGKAGENIVLSTGTWCTAAVDANGSLWIWGRKINGSEVESLIPVKVMDGVTSVSCDGNTAVALKTDGSLWTWGNNQSGQLGIGSKTDSSTPVKVMDGVAAVSNGGVQAAIKTDGSLWVWGWNGTGALGNGGKGNDSGHGIGISSSSGDSVVLAGPPPLQTVPEKVMNNVAAVSCGGYHTAAVKTDGSLWTWGANYDGQLGIGSTEGSNIPVKVMDNVAAVSCGDNHTAAIKADGSLWMWGNNWHCELGNGGTGNAEGRDGEAIQTVPVKVMDSVAAVSCGDNHTAAVKTDGSLWTWGNNRYGQLGIADVKPSAPVSVPVKVTDNVAAVSCGGDHTAAVKTDGSFWAWGSNKYGQLGNDGQGNTVLGGGPAQTVPAQVTGLNVSVSTTAPQQPAETKTANPTNDKLEVNGTAATPTVYKIGSSNYFKIRDVAALLNGTEKQFAVGYAGGRVTVTSGQPYQATGKELAGPPVAAKDTSPSNDAIVIDGVETSLTVYKIGGSNYFKLRDLGKALNFYVGWEAGRGMYIETGRPYSK